MQADSTVDSSLPVAARKLACLPAGTEPAQTAAQTLAQLYTGYRVSVLAHCARFLRDPTLAEDATQEIFLRLQRHVDHLPGTAELRPWLFRVARNYCLNEIRNRDLRTRTLLSLSYCGNVAFDEPVISRSDVQRFLEGLSPRARNVAWLTFVEGMLQRDVATELGLSRRTVVNDLSAVRSQMKAQAGSHSAKRCSVESIGP